MDEKYAYILASADVINQKLQECVSYENEILENNKIDYKIVY